jgi:serine/threonine protein kinase
MASILAGRTLKEYSKHREHSRPESMQPSIAFESNIPACITWLVELKSLPPFKKQSSGHWWKYLLDRIKKMMSMEPEERYSSDQLVNTFPPGPCCQVSLEEYQSLQPQSLLLPSLSEEVNNGNSSDRESTALTLASTKASEASDPDPNNVVTYPCGEEKLEGPTFAFTEVSIAPIPEPQLVHLLETPESELSPPDFDWSGKGAHVQYESQTEVPLHIIELLGLGASSSVHKVRTTINGSYVFAQKMLETRGHILRLEMLTKEVKVLQRLQHPHIVRLIGTAFDKRFFSILTYPAADWTLANFLEIVGAEQSSGDLVTRECKQALHRFTTCLINALDYLHRQGIRHKDIKPSNILVQRWGADENGYHVYLSGTYMRSGLKWGINES